MVREKPRTGCCSLGSLALLPAGIQGQGATVAKNTPSWIGRPFQYAPGGQQNQPAPTRVSVRVTRAVKCRLGATGGRSCPSGRRRSRERGRRRSACRCRQGAPAAWLTGQRPTGEGRQRSALLPERCPPGPAASERRLAAWRGPRAGSSAALPRALQQGWDGGGVAVSACILLPPQRFLSQTRHSWPK